MAFDDPAVTADGLTLLQSIYKNTSVDLATRIDAAARAMQFERPRKAPEPAKPANEPVASQLDRVLARIGGTFLGEAPVAAPSMGAEDQAALRFMLGEGPASPSSTEDAAAALRRMLGED
ncbi:hypothetical protein RQ831_20575 [Roseomonas gilardii]|uniref:Uncharacterized protein n=1 Tax=Roseomonas gilardii TaxID=257708 RepID=A0ABU3MKV6_9PROT|nr:hypothetical protein [Roseomonas gilardii]MDT8333451.1 hypothetical protein [Roseomonas gilardii]